VIESGKKRRLKYKRNDLSNEEVAERNGFGPTLRKFSENRNSCFAILFPSAAKNEKTKVDEEKQKKTAFGITVTSWKLAIASRSDLRITCMDSGVNEVRIPAG
jgi:hypothetical protein